MNRECTGPSSRASNEIIGWNAIIELHHLNRSSAAAVSSAAKCLLRCRLAGIDAQLGKLTMKVLGSSERNTVLEALVFFLIGWCRGAQ